MTRHNYAFFMFYVDNQHFDGRLVKFSYRECKGGNLPFNWIMMPHPHL